MTIDLLSLGSDCKYLWLKCAAVTLRNHKNEQFESRFIPKTVPNSAPQNKKKEYLAALTQTPEHFSCSSAASQLQCGRQAKFYYPTLLWHKVHTWHKYEKNWHRHFLARLLTDADYYVLLQVFFSFSFSVQIDSTLSPSSEQIAYMKYQQIEGTDTQQSLKLML